MAQLIKFSSVSIFNIHVFTHVHVLVAWTGNNIHVHVHTVQISGKLT